MAAGDNTNLTVTIGNTNASTITLTSALTDIFPANMTIAAAGNTGTCTGVTATAGDNKFTMASGTAIPAGGDTGDRQRHQQRHDRHQHQHHRRRRPADIGRQ